MISRLVYRLYYYPLHDILSKLSSGTEFRVGTACAGQTDLQSVVIVEAKALSYFFTYHTQIAYLQDSQVAMPAEIACPARNADFIFFVPVSLIGAFLIYNYSRAAIIFDMTRLCVLMKLICLRFAMRQVLPLT